MADLLVSLDDMKDYLGESGDYADSLITDALLAAQEELERATGKDWLKIEANATAKRIVKMTVWLDFYADRDDAKNTTYLLAARDRLITQLQYGDDEETDDTEDDDDSTEEDDTDDAEA